jgi:hypothetical protein
MSPTADEPATPAANYAAATATLRTTVRWLLTAAAGVGGVLVAGLQLTNLGSLSLTEWRLWVAVVGVLAALGGVGYMVSRAGRILTDDWISLAQLSEKNFDDLLRGTTTTTALLNSIDTYKNELYAHVADSIPQLSKELIEANEQARESTPDSDEAKKATRLREAANSVVQYANYYATRKKSEALYPQLGRAAAVTVVGVLLFAYAANPAKAAKAATPTTPTVEQRSPSPTPSSSPATTPSPTNR